VVVGMLRAVGLIGADVANGEWMGRLIVGCVKLVEKMWGGELVES